MRDERLLVYTCITAGYDDLLPLRRPEPGVRYVCFTDRTLRGDHGWEIRPLPRDDLDPLSANRYVKMHPHLLFPEHGRSVYVDGNLELKDGIAAFADDALREHPLALFSHPFRDCLFHEAAECAAIGYGWIWTYIAQLRRYHRDGMPARAGLYECGILPRRHDAPQVATLMEAWWHEFQGGIRRDQVSLPYLLWKQRTPFKALGLSGIRTDDSPLGRLHPGHKPSTWARTLRGHLNRRTPLFWLLARGHAPQPGQTAA
ncbi:DUF616 domain-containing protein [Ramlibacter sp. USB13]|uniref:DUF616 domain-containing protein n=1 Tax=Ramlibacter cellulosilyticus TaxID=2764187 RepID=A0A923MTS9_9BURK|nr:glycosyltransferase domain-containing protein [Ramlibacter cellulosilyticus]MBC5784881.1 DUF616 domain-containing protein [Ramlibacter cellulosilyticus]